MASMTDILRYVWNFTVFFITNLYGLFSYIMWMLMLLPLRILSPSMYWNFERLLFNGLQSFIVMWMGTGRYRIFESGDDVSQLSEEEVLLLCNHQSTADTPVVMMSLWGKGGCMSSSMWIMDWIFKFTNFGLICTLRKDVFIKQGRETRNQQEVMLREHLKDSYLPLRRKWLVLFPEGGFLYKRLESSQSYARKNGYPVLNNVTLPRLGALRTIIDTIGSPEQDQPSENVTNGCGNAAHNPDQPVKWLVDMTIGYGSEEGGPPDMFGMCMGYREKQDIHVHYRAFPLSDVPRNGDELQKWVYDRYTEKDDLLEQFYRNGHFPEDSAGQVLPVVPERQVLFDWLKVVLFQLFYMGSAYLHYVCVIEPLMSLVWW
ncbi:acyl-CoA:lysophosphatidylglycerol acyltransferase 1-like [Babylonia areolata]|uniref:acyl-CoA:lysophosphatidylglycerol acyltransferase 1-like n=1 Tax=Babylonia areolata TaxID=304850 RepID=UPI003FD1EB72